MLNANDSIEFEHKNDENIVENGENATLLWFIKSYNSVITNLTLRQTTKFSDLPELKSFADANFKVAQMAKFFLVRVENINRKSVNVGFLHFLLYPQCFQYPSF